MITALLALVQHLLSSPWAYLALSALAALDAVAGDHLACAAGAGPGRGLLRRTGRSSRARRAAERVEAGLVARDGALIVAARCTPGGRTLVATTAGATRYPLRRSSAFTALAAVTWALYAASIGSLGGAAFYADPLRGVAMGAAVAVGVTGGAELVRVLARRRRERGRPAPADLHAALAVRG